LAFFLLGPDQQEVENGKNQYERQKGSETAIPATGSLRIRRRNKHL